MYGNSYHTLLYCLSFSNFRCHISAWNFWLYTSLGATTPSGEWKAFRVCESQLPSSAQQSCCDNECSIPTSLWCWPPASTSVSKHTGNLCWHTKTCVRLVKSEPTAYTRTWIQGVISQQPSFIYSVLCLPEYCFSFYVIIYEHFFKFVKCLVNSDLHDKG